MADRPPCKYFEICGLPGHSRPADELYCILHLPPDPTKHVLTFNVALADHIDRGRSDFRRMYFPDTASFDGRHFEDTVDFRDAAVPGMLNLVGVTCDRDVRLGGPAIQNVTLSQAVVRGDLSYDGRIENTCRLEGAVVQGATDLRFSTLAHVQAYKAEFRGRLSLEGHPIAGLDLRYATVRRGIALRGQYTSPNGGTNFSHAKMLGRLDFRDSDFDVHLSFPEAIFDDTSILDLRGARVRGTFALGGLPVVPKEIHLDGARFDDAVRIEAVSGGPKPRVTAHERRPTFGRAVSLKNVDLSDCLLVGNGLQAIEFSNVEWPRRRGRYVLRDEIVYRCSRGILPSDLREACQVLKRKYEEKGDHVRAGDFHYGEMEMKRREYAAPRRWLSWEFAYWMLSGYGVGHVRSLVILVALISGFAALYYLTKPEAFTGVSGALRYSISVAALQRPDVPKQFGELQKWLHVAEAVLGPLQIALFALALRMRLKR